MFIELSNSTQKENFSTKKWASELTKQFSKEETLKVTEYLKKKLQSLRPQGHEKYTYFEIMFHPSQNY